MPVRKTDYEREENMVDALDNFDDSVIHIGNSNEAPMVDSDNVGDKRFFINNPSNSHHHHLITGHSVLIVI